MPGIPESHRDLLDAQWATLATIDSDGRPQLTEVAFLAEGETGRVSLNTTPQKTRNLRRNPAVSLFILDSPTRCASSSCAATPRSSPTTTGASSRAPGRSTGWTSASRTGPASRGWS